MLPKFYFSSKVSSKVPWVEIQQKLLPKRHTTKSREVPEKLVVY